MSVQTQEVEKEPLPEEKAPNKLSHRRMIVYVILFLAIVALFLYLYLHFSDIGEIGSTFAEAVNGDNWKYLLAAIGASLLFFLLYPLPLMTMGRGMKMRPTQRDLWETGNAEHFYNGVTPGSTGGQPFQLYALHLAGAKAANATALILLNYLNIVLVSNIFGLVSLIYYPRYIEGLKTIAGNGVNLISLQWLAVIGIILNAVNLAFWATLGFSKGARRLLEKIGHWVFSWPIIRKHKDRLEPLFVRYLEQTQQGAKEVISHFWLFLFSVLLRILICCIQFSINVFLCLAVGAKIPRSDLPVVFLGTAFQSVCCSWFPTPGAIGASELTATAVTSSVAHLSANAASAVSILWRALSFYLILILSFIVSAAFQMRMNGELKMESDWDRRKWEIRKRRAHSESKEVTENRRAEMVREDVDRALKENGLSLDWGNADMEIRYGPDEKAPGGENP